MLTCKLVRTRDRTRTYGHVCMYHGPENVNFSVTANGLGSYGLMAQKLSDETNDDTFHFNPRDILLDLHV